MPEPIPRRTGRVLLLDAAGRVLLFHSINPDDRTGAAWITVGGGAESGESDRAAAVRELAEETGLRVAEDDLEGPVWVGGAVFPFYGVWYDCDDVYFALRIDGLEVDTAGFTAMERRHMSRYRWWAPAELAATSETVYPKELPAQLPRVEAGPWSGPPVELAKVWE